MNHIFKTIFLPVSLLAGGSARAQDGYVKGSPDLAYWVVGNKPAVVIVLHGGPGAAHDYLRPEWDALAGAARVVYYDQRGCGKSGRAGCYSWKAHVEDLKRVINTVARGEKVFLAGSSWGHTLALLYAYTYPGDIKGIILSGTTPWLGQGLEPRDCPFYLPAAKQIDPAYNIDTFRYATLGAAGQENKKQCEFHGPLSSFTVASMKEAPTLQQLKQVQVPVLLFESKGEGNCDALYREHLKDQAQQYAGILPHLILHTIREACHDPWISHSAEFFTACTGFIQATP